MTYVLRLTLKLSDNLGCMTFEYGTILLFVTLRSNDQAQAYFSFNYKSLVLSTTANLEICGQENKQPTGTPPYSIFILHRREV